MVARAHRGRRRAPLVFVALLTLLGSTAALAGVAPFAEAKRCKGGVSCAADTTPPTVSVAAPASGSVVAGVVSVTGSASDNAALSRVEVSVDGSSYQRASGTTSWSLPVDTRSYSNGSHTIFAVATDTSGNATTKTVTVTVSNTVAPPPPPPPPPPSGSVSNTVISDPKAHNALMLQGRGQIATAGTRQVVLYWEEWTSPARMVVHVRDTATGATSLVDLPVTTGGWSNPSVVLTTGGDLWVLASNAPIQLRQFRLTGSPLPTSATLVSTRTFGDSDSRMGALTQLASGALVAVWHQQGVTGSQGHGIAYRKTDGSWQEQFQNWIVTRSSKDAIAQHPADGSVWLFSDADAFGMIGAAHLTETTTGLRLDWTNPAYISPNVHGDFGPDPEDPDIVAVADPYAGDLVLAYQSAKRLRYTDSLIGSYPAIARLRADGQLSFTHLPVWVERVSRLGLSIRPGEVWLAHRVVNAPSLTANEIQLRVLRAGTWSDPTSLGNVTGSPIATPTGATFAVNTTDQALHLIHPI